MWLEEQSSKYVRVWKFVQSLKLCCKAKMKNTSKIKISFQLLHHSHQKVVLFVLKTKYRCKFNTLGLFSKKHANATAAKNQNTWHKKQH